MRIAFIHGAFSNTRNFSKIKENLPEEHQYVDVNYTNNRSVRFVVDELSEQLVKSDEDTLLIGHSLGGIIALNVANNCPNKVHKVITIATPFLGYQTPYFMKISMPIFSDLCPNGHLIKTLRENELSVPTMCLVATSGLPMGGIENDFIVTVCSQTALDGPRYIKISANHFNIMVANRTISCIKKYISNEFILDGFDGKIDYSRGVAGERKINLA